MLTTPREPPRIAPRSLRYSNSVEVQHPACRRACCSYIQ